MKIINWFKQNWFLWLFVILFYIGLRLFGYDISINKKEKVDGNDPAGLFQKKSRPPLESFKNN